MASNLSWTPFSRAASTAAGRSEAQMSGPVPLDVINTKISAVSAAFPIKSNVAGLVCRVFKMMSPCRLNCIGGDI